MERLTERQKRVLRTIVRFVEREERPPTTRELAEELGCHVKTVYQYILVLERKRAIERRKGRIYVTKAFRRDRGIPIVGRIAAGAPILAEQQIEGCLSLSEMFKERERLFALKVRGDSMIRAQIRDGDYVIVRKQPHVENGEIGVALVGDEATVKRIHVAGSRVRLIPENPNHEPMEFDARTEQVRILGTVVGMVRKMT